MKKITTILECIEEQAKLFLQDTADIKNLNIQMSNNMYKNTTAVDLSDEETLIKIIFTMDDALLQEILLKLLQTDVDNSEREEIFKDLLDEVINIVVGLSIKNFSVTCKNLVLSTPYKPLKVELLNTMKSKQQNFEIVTSKGRLACYIMMEQSLS